MSKKADYQTYVTEQIDAAVTKALTEIQSFCPNVSCGKCKYKDNCISTYRNRMKAMFLKGAAFGASRNFPYAQFIIQLQKLTNHD